MTATDELLPCPFCGSLNVAPRHETVDYDAMHYFVSCRDCQYRGRTLWYEGGYSKRHEQTAINIWNRRADHDRD